MRFSSRPACFVISDLYAEDLERSLTGCVNGIRRKLKEIV
jgi:hypothetical protein